MQAEPTVSTKTYFAVFAALMALLVLTLVAARIQLGSLSVLIALAIAGVKALLILLYFMHVRYSSRLVQIFAVVGFFWLGILFTLAISDYISRNWLDVAGY